MEKNNNSIGIEINEMNKYKEIYSILKKYCDCGIVQEMDFSGKNDGKLAFIICNFYENYNINDLINELDDLNEYINFNDSNSNDKLEYIVCYELIPLLKEYWFDDAKKVKNWANEF